MAYRDNVQALCDEHGRANPIQEEDLKIASLTFYNYSKVPGKTETYVVEASDMNRAGRLFVQLEIGLRHSRYDLFFIKGIAAEFFTPELWDDCSPEKRTLVFGIKTYDLMEMTFK